MKNAFLLKLLEPLATLASGIGKRKKLFILIYHRVLDEPDFMRPDEVDKERFTWQMELLAKHFNVLPLAEALERMQNDTLPPRAVCITFDDGYADNVTNALPILQRYGLKATFFIASGFLDGGRMWNDTVIEAVRNSKASVLDLRANGLGQYDISDNNKKCQTAKKIILSIRHLPPELRNERAVCIGAHLKEVLTNNIMMTSEQLKQLHDHGMEIGGHTVSHPILAKLDNESAEREIKDNKLFLEKLLNTRLRIFAYPNGKVFKDYMPQQVQIVKDAGYLAAVSTQSGITHKTSDWWQLPRFTPWDTSPLKFMIRMLSKYNSILINLGI